MLCRSMQFTGTPIVQNEGHTNLAVYIAKVWCYTEVRACPSVSSLRISEVICTLRAAHTGRCLSLNINTFTYCFASSLLASIGQHKRVKICTNKSSIGMIMHALLLYVIHDSAIMYSFTRNGRAWFT